MPARPCLTRRLRRTARHARSPIRGRFQGFIFGVIVVQRGRARARDLRRDRATTTAALLTLLNDVFLGIFVVEMAIRISAYGRRPQDFFRRAGTSSTSSSIGAAFVPGVRENATLLRLVRLLRVVRLVSVLPDLRVLDPRHGSARCRRSAAWACSRCSSSTSTAWSAGSSSATSCPSAGANIGDAMLTLFTVLTLEGWNDDPLRGAGGAPVSWIFFVSFVLLASLLLINILIAIIINAMEEARAAERREELERAQRARPRRPAASTTSRSRRRGGSPALKQALEDLEEQLGIETASCSEGLSASAPRARGRWPGAGASTPGWTSAVGVAPAASAARCAPAAASAASRCPASAASASAAIVLTAARSRRCGR